MSTLIFITLLGVFAHHCIEIEKNFKGRWQNAKIALGLIGYLGYTIFYITLIWSFWHFKWWQPILALISYSILGGFSAIVFQRSIFGILASPVLTILFAIFSIIGLVQA